MNTMAPKPLPFMTADDFLAWPGDGTGRTFQLIDGEVRPVSPAARIHGAIQSNLVYQLQLAIELAGLDCEVLTEGAIQPSLHAATNVRVPDVLVAPATGQEGDQTVPDPILIIEVLSPGNQDDTRDNIRVYATLPSVQEMAVLSSTSISAEIHRRDASGAWAPTPETIISGDRLRLPSVGLDVPLALAYAKTYLAR